jgi:hypothetical protein
MLKEEELAFGPLIGDRSLGLADTLQVPTSLSRVRKSG